MSVVLNTKKELFLGKRPFKSRKMDKDEFASLTKELYDKIKNQYKDEYEDYFEEDNNTADSQLWAIDIFANEYDGDELPEELKLYYEDLSEVIGAGMTIMNWEDEPGQFSIQTLDNGFTYMKVYSSVGDDAFRPMCNIIYFNQDNKLRLYVPYCGNLVFVGADTQMCVYGGYGEEEREIKKLFDEAKSSNGPAELNIMGNVFMCYDKDETFYKLYGQKYGMNCSDEDFNSDEDFVFDEELMLEDIKSNVILE
jgi:hypothetical protein